MRRLAPTLTEDDFVSLVAPLCEAAGLGDRGGHWDVLYYAPGSQSATRGTITGAGYIKVNKDAPVKVRPIAEADPAAAPQVTALQAAFTTYFSFEKHPRQQNIRPVVCAAPYQRLFRENVRRDPLNNTLEKDRDYQAFLEKLQAPTEKLPALDAWLEEQEKDDGVKKPNTLLDFLIARRGARAKHRQKGKAAADKRKQVAGKGMAGDPGKKGRSKGRGKAKGGKQKEGTRLIGAPKGPKPALQGGAVAGPPQEGGRGQQSKSRSRRKGRGAPGGEGSRDERQNAPHGGGRGRGGRGGGRGRGRDASGASAPPPPRPVVLLKPPAQSSAP